jgi:hypothetical protein
MAGVVAPVTARPSINGLNLTFRDMLDVGDGVEGDLNSRSRNQRWKEFCSFSAGFDASYPAVASSGGAPSAADSDQDDGGSSSTRGGVPPSLVGGSSFGSSSTSPSLGGTADGGGAVPPSGSKKRDLSPSSSTGSRASATGGGGNAGAPGGGKPDVAGGPGQPRRGGPGQHQQQHQQHQKRTLAGAHRGAVSVNDMAVLRRAASRMRMAPVTGEGAGGPVGAFATMMAASSASTATARLPGETLGGGMLSRIRSGPGAGGAGPDAAANPLAQIMARKGAESGGGGGGGGGGRGGNPQQMELFMQKLNQAMGGDALGGGGGMGTGIGGMGAGAGGYSASGAGGMGRRSCTVGAGLAYGRADMSVDVKPNGFRMSRFNLGQLQQESSRLSQLSTGESSAGSLRNEEWNLS